MPSKTKQMIQKQIHSVNHCYSLTSTDTCNNTRKREYVIDILDSNLLNLSFWNEIISIVIINLAISSSIDGWEEDCSNSNANALHGVSH